MDLGKGCSGELRTYNRRCRSDYGPWMVTVGYIYNFGKVDILSVFGYRVLHLVLVTRANYNFLLVQSLGCSFYFYESVCVLEHIKFKWLVLVRTLGR